MAITDLWGNSLNGITTDVIGYRGEFTEFPHQLYSYLSSTIRDDDQRDIALIYRWLLGAQSYWEAQYNSILGVLTLLSPELCPEDYLDYLKYNVGISKSLDYLWGTMTTNEKRIFIQNYTDIIKFRYSDQGIKLSLEKLTKEFVYLRDFFFYRWIISGEAESEMETAIGFEDDNYDPWLIGDDKYLTGYKPDDLTVGFGYLFKITTLINDFGYENIPSHVYVRCFVTNVSEKGEVYKSGSDYYVEFPFYYFEQDTSIASSDTNQFRVSMESDPYTSDILITNRDGSLNTDMIEALVKFNRPASERFYIRYFKWIDQFDNDYFWDDSDPDITMTHNSTDKSITLLATNSLAVSFVDVNGADDWEDYELKMKIKYEVALTKYRVVFMYQDTQNYYYLRVYALANYEHCAWYLRKVVAGVHSTLDSGTLPIYDIDVYYLWRINCWTSNRAAGDVQIIQCYRDEELLTNFEESLNWTPTKGKIGLILETNGNQATIDGVSVRPIPVEDTYIGL